MDRRPCQGGSPGDVEVIPFVDDFLRSGAAGRDTLRVGRPSSEENSRSWSDDVDSASLEVERARDATHSAVALSSAATAGDTETRNGPQESAGVQGGMWRQPPDPLRFLGRELHPTHAPQTTRADALTPRERIVSGASSVHPPTTVRSVESLRDQTHQGMPETASLSSISLTAA